MNDTTWIDPDYTPMQVSFDWQKEVDQMNGLLDVVEAKIEELTDQSLPMSEIRALELKFFTEMSKLQGQRLDLFKRIRSEVTYAYWEEKDAYEEEQ